MSDETLSVEGNNGFGIVKEILEANKSLLTEITLLSREYQPTAAFNDQAVVPIADKIDFTQLHEYLQEENILKYPHVGYIPEIITPLVQTPFHIISWWEPMIGPQPKETQEPKGLNHSLYGIFVPNENLLGGSIVIVETDAWLYGDYETTEVVRKEGVVSHDELVTSQHSIPNSFGATIVLGLTIYELAQDKIIKTREDWILIQLQAIHSVSKKANKPKNQDNNISFLGFPPARE